MDRLMTIILHMLKNGNIIDFSVDVEDADSLLILMWMRGKCYE